MPYTAFDAHAYLHHIAFYSSKPNELANFYKTVLDMKKERFKSGFLLKGNNRKVIVLKKAKSSLAFAGFACQDREALAEEVRAEGGDCDFKIGESMRLNWIALQRADPSLQKYFEHFKDIEKGRTPNPDILCNREIKFKSFLDYALRIGADHIATGHYARTRRKGSLTQLLKGADPNKDQSYFLYQIPQNFSLIFPFSFPSIPIILHNCIKMLAFQTLFDLFGTPGMHNKPPPFSLLSLASLFGLARVTGLRSIAPQALGYNSVSETCIGKL